MLIKVLWAGLGGFIGAAARFSALLLISKLPMSSKFPMATMIINVVGAMVMGAVTQLPGKFAFINADAMVFLTVGILGGFTTFSAFSYETVLLFEKGRTLLAIAYILGSVILCMIGIVFGRMMISLLTKS